MNEIKNKKKKKKVQFLEKTVLNNSTEELNFNYFLRKSMTNNIVKAGTEIILFHI